MRPIPLAVLPLIHEFEQGPDGGFAPQRYLDPVGKPTIGYGHLLSGPSDPLWDAVLDQGSADQLAMKDQTIAAEGVCASLGDAIDTINDNQYAALIDFTFNVGEGAFAGSTMCRMIRNGSILAAANEFDKWVYADGKVLPGLQRRRAAERTLYLA